MRAPRCRCCIGALTRGPSTRADSETLIPHVSILGFPSFQGSCPQDSRHCSPCPGVERDLATLSHVHPNPRLAFALISSHPRPLPNVCPEQAAPAPNCPLIWRLDPDGNTPPPNQIHRLVALDGTPPRPLDRLMIRRPCLCSTTNGGWRFPTETLPRSNQLTPLVEWRRPPSPTKRLGRPYARSTTTTRFSIV